MALNLFSQRHADLVEKVRMKLLGFNWQLPQLDLGPWESASSLVAFKPDRGAVGIVCHARANPTSHTYCVRSAQVKRCCAWDGPVYFVFENGYVVDAKVFMINAIPMAPIGPGHKPYGQMLNSTPSLRPERSGILIHPPELKGMTRGADCRG